MYGINDWDKRKQRHSAFWEGEIVDRCLVTILGGMKEKNTFDPTLLMTPENPEDRLKYFTDGEWVLKRHKNMWDNFTKLGDGFPLAILNLGPSGHAGYFKGVEHEIRDTIWFHKLAKGIELEFDEQGFWYQKTMELAKYLVNESKGEFIVSMPDASGNLDVLSLLKGADDTLMDLFMGEGYLEPALEKIQHVWKRTINDVYDIVKDNNDGGSSIGWLFTWAPGLSSQMQCDLSTMISPELYEKYALPELTAQANMMDNALYHFDGEEQIRHLDHLLSIKNLKAIQWTSVAGQPSPMHHIDSLKRIQAAGKSLLLNLSDPTLVEPLMENLSSKGLHLVVPAGNEEHAQYILNTVERLTHE